MWIVLKEPSESCDSGTHRSMFVNSQQFFFKNITLKRTIKKMDFRDLRCEIEMEGVSERLDSYVTPGPEDLECRISGQSSPVSVTAGTAGTASPLSSSSPLKPSPRIRGLDSLSALADKRLARAQGRYVDATIFRRPPG